jgi:2-polyprenyl-3-methyl-5-hydroxy-6-metoxy-1,4-benzoquinol methylase
MATKFSVKDIHAPGVAENFDLLTLKDLKNLLLNRDKFVESDCPACRGSDTKDEFQYQGLGYRRCSECETLFISPAPTEEAHLDYVVNSSAMAYWRNSMPVEMKNGRRPMYVDRVAYFLEMQQKYGWNPKSSLEIGAGNGEFAEELAAVAKIEQIVLLEPQDLDVKGHNIKIIKGGFEELKSTNQLFDIVFSWEVIEHILEPDHFLRLIRGVLKSGRPLILSTPNERSVETRELGTDSSNILFDHVRLYNPNSITKLLNRNGFRVIEISTPGKLDVERLMAKQLNNPEYFENNPSLRYILSQNTEVMDSFQLFLQENLQSSHMRVTAVVDDAWKA